MLGVGTLSLLKDFSTFVRVIAILHREGVVHRAVLLGDGPERHALHRQIQAAKLDPVIEWRHSLPRAAVLETMADARVLLHPSRYEGFGMVFAEARSRGMSIVSRAVGLAEASPGWRVCHSDAEFADACRSQLKPEYELPTGQVELLVRTTADRHAALYRSVVGTRWVGTRWVGPRA